MDKKVEALLLMLCILIFSGCMISFVIWILGIIKL